jgi:hypothetical protein
VSDEHGAGQGILTTIVKSIRGDPNLPIQEKTRRGVRTFFIFFLFGALMWILFVALSNKEHFLPIFSRLGLLTASATITGSFLGFLFGIPRVFTVTDSHLVEQSRVVPNTNLEQISDWLTKILVGVGLTQLQSLPTKLKTLSAMLDPIIPLAQGGSGGGIIAVATIIAYLLAGFLWAYFESRTALMALFEQGSVEPKPVTGTTTATTAPATPNH